MYSFYITELINSNKRQLINNSILFFFGCALERSVTKERLDSFQMGSLIFITSLKWSKKIAVRSISLFN